MNRFQKEDDSPRNFVTRDGKFDAAHRVLHERFKCFNLHGHEYHYELTFSWSSSLDLGYAIDFKEIKRVVCEWIDETMDHGFIANPQDLQFISICNQLGLKVYRMNGAGTDSFCNPTAENIAKELFYAADVLLSNTGLNTHSVKLWETMNCHVECTGLSAAEQTLFETSDLTTQLLDWKSAQGTVEYDARRVLS
ncbi:MAG: 6-carboxytetrahydropterin synthase [Deltaproteobacteria bacterium]|nr:6-carboxytetrahydropterin synthase [Deltaproteobacteria bacterium]MBI3293429.1 6-carboxytetrahydropterin synthase [Deltaproteobacteria bacterium]